MTKAIPGAHCALILGLYAPLLQAHHSYAMFDRSRQLTASGTVKELQWTNPHCWLQVLVVDPRGQTKEYGFEAVGGPDTLRRHGWTRNSVRPGDQVTVRYNPLRNGDSGGELIAVALSNGHVLNAAPAAVHSQAATSSKP